MGSRSRKNDRVKVTCVTLLSVVLVAIAALLGMAIGLNSWIYTSPISKSQLPNTRWAVGLWSVCLQSNTSGMWITAEKCTTILDATELYRVANRQNWKPDMLMGCMMCSLMASATIVAALPFLLCAYLPSSKCHMVGKGGLPATVITSGAFQLSLIIMLTTSSVVKTTPMEFGTSFYLAVSSTLLTWFSGMASLIAICRTS